MTKFLILLGLFVLILIIVPPTNDTIRLLDLFVLVVELLTTIQDLER